MKKKLLLVDDDLTLSHLLAQYLRETGFLVIEADNGQAGLRAAYNEKPDLVLLDIMLPGMDGWDVCNRLRELTDVPIIMLTAKATEADKLHGFSLGVDDYVTKPFSFAELTARIQAVLGRADPLGREEDFLAYGEIVLDLKKIEASLAGRLLPLTPTEFRLLEALVRKQGKVASETELIRDVWGGQSGDSALVRRYVSLLRKKIESDPSSPRHLLTVRGFGYRLVLD
jgi:DNA-binding response OmpR family regulator